MRTFIDVLVSVKVFALGEGIAFEGALELVAVDELDEIFLGFGKHWFRVRFGISMKVF